MLRRSDPYTEFCFVETPKDQHPCTQTTTAGTGGGRMSVENRNSAFLHQRTIKPIRLLSDAPYFFGEASHQSNGRYHQKNVRNKRLTMSSSHPHSVLKLLIGLANAVLTISRLTTIRAMI